MSSMIYHPDELNRTDIRDMYKDPVDHPYTWHCSICDEEIDMESEVLVFSDEPYKMYHPECFIIKCSPKSKTESFEHGNFSDVRPGWMQDDGWGE